MAVLLLAIAALFAAPAYAQDATPLTASFVAAPAEHKGDGTTFTLNLRFSENIDASDNQLRNQVLSVANGRVTVLKKIDRRKDYWFLKIAPDSNLAVTISLKSGTDCTAQDVACTSDDRPLSAAVAVTVASPEADTQTLLTARFEDVPEEHGGDGHAAYRFRLLFSEPVRSGHAQMYNHIIKVENGRLHELSRVDRRKDYWELAVRPDSRLPITVSLESNTRCRGGAVACTIDSRPLSAAVSATIMGPPGLSVADVEVTEADGATLDFVVTLSRSRQRVAQVHYRTINDTAIAGEDYVYGYGFLTFDPGDTSKTVQIEVIDDGHDEDEQLRFQLYDPYGAWLNDGEAVGTIKNTDPMPSAWLARFGRTASQHVVDAIGQRLSEDSPKARRAHRNVTGLSVAGLFGPAGGARNGSAVGEERHVANGSFQDPPIGRLGPFGSGFGPRGAGLTGFGQAAAENAGRSRSRQASGNLTPHDVLRVRSFSYSSADEDSGSGGWTAWGRTAITQFAGADAALSLDGEVATEMLGIDFERGKWLTGLVLSRSSGDGSYVHGERSDAAITSTLLSLYPFVGYRLNERTRLWSVLGYGAGDLSLTPGGAAAIETDLAVRMGAFGGRSVVSAAIGRGGSYQLAVRTDAMLTETVSQETTGLKGAVGSASRMRLLLEGSGALPLPWGGELRPVLEAGLRYDGGDAETGAGLELGGGLSYGIGRLTARVNARRLLTHGDGSYRESGFSGSFTYRARDDGRGMALNLGLASGATEAGAYGLWSGATATELAQGRRTDMGRRYEAELSYGLDRGAALWEPFVAVVSDARSLLVGLRARSGPDAYLGVQLGRHRNMAGEAGFEARLEGRLRL